VRQRAVPLMVTCAQCRAEVLEADLLGDEEECALRGTGSVLVWLPGTNPESKVQTIADAWV